MSPIDTDEEIAKLKAQLEKVEKEKEALHKKAEEEKTVLRAEYETKMNALNTKLTLDAGAPKNNATTPDAGASKKDEDTPEVAASSNDKVPAGTQATVDKLTTSQQKLVDAESERFLNRGTYLSKKISERLQEIIYWSNLKTILEARKIPEEHVLEIIVSYFHGSRHHASVFSIDGVLAVLRFDVKDVMKDIEREMMNHIKGMPLELQASPFSGDLVFLAGVGRNLGGTNWQECVQAVHNTNTRVCAIWDQPQMTQVDAFKEFFRSFLDKNGVTVKLSTADDIEDSISEAKNRFPEVTRQLAAVIPRNDRRAHGFAPRDNLSSRDLHRARCREKNLCYTCEKEGHIWMNCPNKRSKYTNPHTHTHTSKNAHPSVYSLPCRVTTDTRTNEPREVSEEPVTTPTPQVGDDAQEKCEAPSDVAPMSDDDGTPISDDSGSAELVEFVVDSGASMHQIESTDKGINRILLQLADDSVKEYDVLRDVVAGYDDVKLRLTKPVRGGSINLLSVKKLVEDNPGVSVVLEKERSRLLVGDRVIPLNHNEANGTWTLFMHVDSVRGGMWHIRNPLRREMTLAQLHSLTHTCYDHLERLARSNELGSIVITDWTKVECAACAANMNRSPFVAGPDVEVLPGEEIHADLKGPVSHLKFYLLVLVDKGSSFHYVRYLENKHRVHEAITALVPMIETQTGVKVKRFVSDNGGEFSQLDRFFRDRGIHMQRTVPHSPQQNGMAERGVGTAIERLKSFVAAGIPWSLARYVVPTVQMVLNMFRFSRRTDMPVYKKFTGNTPETHWIAPVGALVSFRYTNTEFSYDPNGGMGMLIGHCDIRKGYYVWTGDANGGLQVITTPHIDYFPNILGIEAIKNYLRQNNFSDHS